MTVERERGCEVLSALERKYELMRIMEGRREEKSENLAVELGVDERTIRRYVTALEAEYPITMVRGNGGGVKLPKGYREYMGGISEKQQNSLMKAISVVDEEAAKDLCELLRAQGSFRNKSKIEEVIDNFYANAYQDKAI